MKRIVSLAAVAGLAVILLIPAPSGALDLPFNVRGNSPFLVDAFVVGNLQIILNAAWTKKNADLDMVVLCGEDEDLLLASISTEPKNEMASLGMVGGPEGVDCVIAVVSFRGSSKGNLTVLFTGIESAASGVDFVGASYEERPAVTEAIRQLRIRKSALLGR